MVLFESKVASKGLDTLNSGAGAASEVADLSIRIWVHDASGNAGTLSWKSESVLVYMIADLVAASQGRTATESPGGLAAHFDNSFQALAAARRIQTAILEFLECRPGDCMGAAVLIHPTAATGFSQAMAQSALRLAEPGQIILSETVSKAFQELPGIELRAVAALTTGGTEHSGLAELIWTSAERVAKLRTSASAAPAVNIGATVGATMIVNAPLAPFAPVGGRHPQSPPSSVARRTEVEVKEPTAGDADGFSHGKGSFDEDSDRRGSLFTRLPFIVGSVAVVLVCAALALFHPWSSSREQPVQHKDPINSAGGTNSIPENPTPTIPSPPPAVEPQPELQPTPPPRKPPVNGKTSAERAAKDKDKSQAKDKEPAKKPEETIIHGFEGISDYDGMTPKNIPTLLQWARSDAGNGNYSKAAQEYRVVLKLQPDNPDAKEGLRKIIVAQSGR